MDLPNVETNLPKAVPFARGRNFAFNVRDLRCLGRCLTDAVQTHVGTKLELTMPRPLLLAFSILVPTRAFIINCYLMICH
jgi:hypothetical protein